MAEVKELFRENNTVYLVTEYISGGSLNEFLSSRPRQRISGEEAVKILFPVMEALSFLHSIGIVHGGINGDRLIFDENGVCRFTGLGTCGMRVVSGEEGMAPELKDGGETAGPWSDIYGVCGLLYKMLTGKTLTEARQKLHKEMIKPVSMYTEVDENLEVVIMQGLEPEIQRRFFYMGALAERLGAECVEMTSFLSAIQEKWGDAWIKISFTESKTGNRNRYFRFTRRQKRIFTAAAAGTALFITAGISGIYLYGETHPKERLRFHLLQDARYAQKNPVEGITKETEGYEELIEYLKANGIADEYSNGIRYTLEENQMKSRKLSGNTVNKFPVREDTLREALGICLGEDFTDSVSAQKTVSVFVNNGKKGKTETAFFETVCYPMKEEEAYTAELRYDISDKRVTGVKVNADEESCRKVLREILPILVPETYLTDKETDELCQQVEDNEGSYACVRHGLYQMTLKKRESLNDVPVWSAEIESCRYYEKDEEYKDAAGNYARGSREYRDFMSFLQKYAAVTEGTDGTVTYILSEDEVLKWGKPSNDYLLFLTKEEFLDKMKENGYEMSLEKTSEDYRVTDKKYGILESGFYRKEKYRLGESLCISVICDLVSEKLWGVSVYSEKQDLSEIASCGADVTWTISADVEEREQELREYYLEQMEEYRQYYTENPDSSLYMGESYEDCMCLFSNDLNGKYYGMIFSRSGLGLTDGYGAVSAPYFWPVSDYRK